MRPTTSVMSAMTTTPTACEMRSLATTRSVWAPAIVLTDDQPTQAMQLRSATIFENGVRGQLTRTP